MQGLMAPLPFTKVTPASQAPNRSIKPERLLKTTFVPHPITAAGNIRTLLPG